MSRYLNTSIKLEAIRFLGFAADEGHMPADWTDDAPPPMFSAPVTSWVADGLGHDPFAQGSLTPTHGNPDDDEPQPSMLWAMGPNGLVAVLPGMWIVRQQSGLLLPLTHEAFSEACAIPEEDSMATYTRVEEDYEAVQFAGFGEEGFAPDPWEHEGRQPPRFGEELPAWASAALANPLLEPGSIKPDYGWSPPMLKVFTNSGLVDAQPGQWIVRASTGALLTFTPEVFEANFKPKPPVEEGD